MYYNFINISAKADLGSNNVVLLSPPWGDEFIPESPTELT